MLVAPLPQTIHASDISPERLAGNTSLTERQKIAEASRQFEAILLRQILAATQKPVIASKLVDNSTSADIYRDMITHELAESISKSGAFGLAKTFEHQFTRPEQGTPTSDRPHPSTGELRNAGSTSASTLKSSDSRNLSFPHPLNLKLPNFVNTHERTAQ